MNDRPQRSRLAYAIAIPLAALVAVIAVVLAAAAVAKTFALQIAGSATVTNSSTGHVVKEGIVVDTRARAVYELSSDSTHHPACTIANGCFAFWPPVKATSRHPRLAPGIKGKLGVFHRDGFAQLTLNGHPLYDFGGDARRDVAAGQGIKSFGGTWSVIRTSRTSTAVPAEPTTTAPATTVPTYTTSTTPGW